MDNSEGLILLFQPMDNTEWLLLQLQKRVMALEKDKAVLERKVQDLLDAANIRCPPVPSGCHDERCKGQREFDCSSCGHGFCADHIKEHRQIDHNRPWYPLNVSHKCRPCVVAAYKKEADTQ